MKRQKLIDKINEMCDQYAEVARPYEEIDTRKDGAIFVSCERNWIGGLPVAMYYENWEHPEFKKLMATIPDWHWEWTNPGCIGLYKD